MEIKDKKKVLKALYLMVFLINVFNCIDFIYHKKFFQGLSVGCIAIVFLLLFLEKTNNRILLWFLLLIGIGFWLIQFLSNFWDKY